MTAGRGEVWPAQVEDSAEGSGSAEELTLALCLAPRRDARFCCPY